MRKRSASRTSRLSFLLVLAFVSMAGCEIASYPYYIIRNKLNVTFVLDVSGSMGPEQIASMKQAVIVVLDRLNENDLVSIVTFDSSAYLVLEPVYVVDRAHLESVVESLPVTGGGTDIYLGMVEGYRQVEKNYDEELVNRIILLSDGQSAGEMVALAEDKKNQGISASTIALGSGAATGLLSSIAERGGGSYYQIDDPENISQAFQDEIDYLLVPVEKWPPGRSN